ncbi:MAG: hypothetical protein MUO63_03295 [Desulfobulbaceae bacterium]|nr:hypothetical protein [Desulfobulbaceae bacterium]
MTITQAYAVHALKTILFKGTGISSISTDLAFLACFTVLMLTTAVLTFKRSVG